MPPDIPTSSARFPLGTGALNLDEIVRASIAIADEGGLDALSMRRVAERLGRGVMSLYRHVEDKERLVALASDAVFAEEPFPRHPSSAWKVRLRESAWRQWRCYLRHPWIASVVSIGRPRLGPNGIREMEWAFGGMRDLGVSSAEKLQLYLVVTAFVHGAAGQMASEATDVRRSGQGTKAWWEAQADVLRDLFASGEFPLVSRLRAGAEPSPASWFEFGLECLLDGLELELARRTGPGG